MELSNTPCAAPSGSGIGELSAHFAIFVDLSDHVCSNRIQLFLIGDFAIKQKSFKTIDRIVMLLHHSISSVGT